MDHDLLIGIDLGTSELKAGLFDRSGRLLGLGRAAYPTEVDGSGRAEQDPDAWWAALVTSVRDLPVGGRPVRAMAVVGQGPTLSAVDEAGRPVRPAITWLDRRPNAADSFSLLPRMAWLADADPGGLAASRWLMAAFDALALRLTGVAAGTVQRHEHAFSEAELATARIEPRFLPPFRPSGSMLGGLTTAAAHELGLTPETLVVAGINDGAASMIGAGLLEPGDAVDTGGASGGLAVCLDEPAGRALILPPGFYSAPAPVPGRWIVGGAMSGTGAALGWLSSKVLAGRWSLEDLLAQAQRVPPGADGLVFLPYLAGARAPTWDATARGVFTGLTLAHGRGHLVRAIVEAGGFSVRHVAEPIVAAGAPIRELRLAAGLARDHGWAQLRADTTGLPVALPEVEELGVLGAAILAAAGSGLEPDLEAATRSMTRVRGRMLPRPETREVYDRAYRTYVALHAALAPTFAALAPDPSGASHADD